MRPEMPEAVMRSRRAAACGSSGHPLAGAHAGEHLDLSPSALRPSRTWRSIGRAVARRARRPRQLGAAHHGLLRHVEPACRRAAAAAGQPGAGEHARRDARSPAGRSSRSSSVWRRRIDRRQQLRPTGLIALPRRRLPGSSTRSASRRAPARPRVCGTAALTRSAAGSYSVSSARPGIAMSPSTTATSATTPP